MATKPEVKSKIPITFRKKDTAADKVEIKVCNRVKTVDTKSKKEDKPNIVRKIFPKKQKEHAKVTMKEKAACTGESMEQKPAKHTLAPLKIETISKDLVAELLSGKLQISGEPLTTHTVKCPDITTAKEKSPSAMGEKKETTPSILPLPKKYVAHSGMIIKPNPSKTTSGGIFRCDPKTRLRRSKSVLVTTHTGISSGAPNIHEKKEKPVFSHMRSKAVQKMDIVKPPVLSENQRSAQLKKNCVEVTVPSKKHPAPSVKLPERNPEQNTAKHTYELKSRPLRRSKTMNTYDYGHISKKTPVTSAFLPRKGTVILKGIKAKAIPKPENENPVSATGSKNYLQLDEASFEDVCLTPKKLLPHGGLVFKPKTQRMSTKTFSTLPAKGDRT